MAQSSACSSTEANYNAIECWASVHAVSIGIDKVFVGVQVKGLDGNWQPVPIPSNVKAIVLLNLQSYGGGRDIWGLADNNKDTQRGWKTPIFNDGMFEVGSWFAC